MLLLDFGSSIDILFKSTLNEIGITDLGLEHINIFLKGFKGGRLTPLRVMKLPMTIDSKHFEKKLMLDFVVVNEDSPYQIILGRPFIHKD